MRNGWLRSLCVLLTMMGAVACAQAQGNVEIEVAFPNLSFNRPVDLQHAGDGSGRLFVVEQAGRIRAFPNHPEAANTTRFLDIADRVHDQGNEEGLLGLAFHPDFSQNGLFFVYYTAANPRRSVLARFRRDPLDPQRADPRGPAARAAGHQGQRRGAPERRHLRSGAVAAGAAARDRRPAGARGLRAR